MGSHSPPPGEGERDPRPGRTFRALIPRSLFLYVQDAFLPSATLFPFFPAVTPLLDFIFLTIPFIEFTSCFPRPFMLSGETRCALRSWCETPSHCSFCSVTRWAPPAPCGCSSQTPGIPHDFLAPIPSIQPTNRHLSGFYLLKST